MRIIITLLFVIFLSSCAKKEARRPVMVKTDTFLKESAKKNRALLQDQEAVMDSIIAKELHTYLKSEDGFKYYYVTENKEATYKPAFGDRVDFSYSLSDIYGKEIYSKEDTKVITYYVDKQELFQGLRQAIKLLKENEEAVFFFPSEIAFGYHGDKEKIGINKPIRAQVHILKITPASVLSPPPAPESAGLVECN